MTKNANFVSHKKSKLKNQDGSPQLPSASALVEGEIAINFGKDVETLSIKNESGDVVTFSSDNYYTEKKLGSGFTGSNSAVTVTEALENIEIDVDQVLDDTTSANTNPVSSKAVYDKIVDTELVWTNAYVAMSGAVSSHTVNTNIHLADGDREKIDSIDTLSGTVTAHTANTEIHVTAADKTAWNAKVDASAIADFFDDAKYEDSGTTKVINFYHGNTIKATIDASDFIVDGMVDDVRIENGNLVIDFNTASGKQDISIPLTDIFDPSNYYNKTAIDNLVGSGFTSSSITDVIIENEEIVSAALTDLDERKLDASAYTPIDLSNYYTKDETSGKTEISTALDGKSNTGHTHVIGNITNLQTTLDGKANTATTLAGYGITNAYTKSETSGATEISNALSGKVNTSDIISEITPSNSGSTAPIATKVVAENELTVSNALNDLNAALNGKANIATTISAGDGLSGGGDLSANITISLKMPTTYSAETYTSSTITSSEPIVYALVSYSGATDLNNQVCPVSGLADGQQCNVIYHSANNNAYNAVISTSYVEPDGQGITLNIPAGGYAEINYINIKGIIFVRGI